MYYPVTWCGLSGAVKMSRQAGRAGISDANVLSWHLSAQTITFKLLSFLLPFPLCDFTSRSSNYLAFFICECVCKLQTCYASLSALLPLLSLLSPLAGTGRVKGGERVCVKWALYCCPSSNTLSLEWAGNNPWGSVQSNCNPQHIPVAGSPLQCCSGAGAGGARTNTRMVLFLLIC